MIQPLAANVTYLHIFQWSVYVLTPVLSQLDAVLCASWLLPPFMCSLVWLLWGLCNEEGTSRCPNCLGSLIASGLPVSCFRRQLAAGGNRWKPVFPSQHSQPNPSLSFLLSMATAAKDATSSLVCFHLGKSLKDGTGMQEWLVMFF